jgi:hypothetical protein
MGQTGKSSNIRIKQYIYSKKKYVPFLNVKSEVGYDFD